MSFNWGAQPVDPLLTSLVPFVWGGSMKTKLLCPKWLMFVAICPL